MVEQIFSVLFALTLVGPVAAVAAGVVLLAWPRGNAGRQVSGVHQAPARV